MTKKPPPSDFSGRDTTRPGAPRRTPQPIAAVVGDLDDTIDEADLTPVGEIAAGVRADLAELSLSDRDRRIVEVACDALIARLGRRLEIGDRIHVRLAELETWRKVEADPHRLRLTGYGDTNGRLGDLDRTVERLREDCHRADVEILERVEPRIPKDAEERAAEKSTLAAVRWTGLKAAAWLALVAVAVGGGIWTSIKAQAVVARYEGRREQHEIDQDRRLDRCDPAPNRSTP